MLLTLSLHYCCCVIYSLYDIGVVSVFEISLVKEEPRDKLSVVWSTFASERKKRKKNWDERKKRKQRLYRQKQQRIGKSKEKGQSRAKRRAEKASHRGQILAKRRRVEKRNHLAEKSHQREKSRNQSHRSLSNLPGWRKRRKIRCHRRYHLEATGRCCCPQCRDCPAASPAMDSQTTSLFRQVNAEQYKRFEYCWALYEVTLSYFVFHSNVIGYFVLATFYHFKCYSMDF